jgi:hypothetical protein
MVFVGGKMVWYQPINCTHTQMTKSFTNGFCWWEDGMVSTHQLYTHPNDQVIYKWFLLVGRWYGINPSIVFVVNGCILYLQETFNGLFQGW